MPILTFPDHTVTRLRTTIEQKTGVLPDQGGLMLGENYIQDTATLSDCGMQSGDTISF
jgi:hypothetical protein